MIEAILREKSRYEFDRVSLDRLGKDALDAGKIDEAVEIFKLIVDVLPPSADAHESLADAYRLRGDGPRAIEHYKEALKIDSERERVKAMLRELEKK
jgi:tetratricopeptide (TPR) repeat protein